jgi:hypothetical protein
MPRRVGRIIQGAGKAVEAVADSAGDRLRWSTKNTMGGLIVSTACEQIVVHGITWESIALCFVGVLPLALSTLES